MHNSAHTEQSMFYNCIRQICKNKTVSVVENANRKKKKIGWLWLCHQWFFGMYKNIYTQYQKEQKIWNT